VRYLNIGDPIRVRVPDAASSDRGGRAGHARRAQRLRPVAGHPAGARGRRGRNGLARVPIDPDRVLLTSGRRKASSWRSPRSSTRGTRCWCRSPTYPLYTAVLAKIGAEAVFYRTDPARGWLPDLDHLRRLDHPNTRALVVIDPNNPTGAMYPPAMRRALIELADAHNLPLLADEVYGDLAYDGPVPAMAASIRTRRSSRSRRCRRRTWRRAGARAGWRSAARRGSTTCWRRSRSWPTAGCAAPARCSTRSWPRSRRPLAPGRRSARAAPRAPISPPRG
jgi:histidinol-phosphate/aromatic aminotransferase/cobyric acid decarboxylase-like protein